MQLLNRQETEDLILDLYHNQKKTFREIQRIVRKSPRDIRAILNKVEPGRSSSFSVSSRAYQMFKEGSTPTDVAIALNLREKEANEYYQEYWNLNGLYNLNQIYEEIKNDLWSVVNLYNQIKAQSMNEKQVIRLLKIASNDLPSVEHRCQELERKEDDLKFSNEQAERKAQEISDRISSERKTLAQFDTFLNQQQQEIDRLYSEKKRLQNLVEQFRNNNEIYTKINEIVKQEVENALGDRRRFLRASLRSLISSLFKDPHGFYAYYFNTPLRDTPLGGQCIQDDKTREDYEELVIDEAERLYSRTVENITNEVIANLSENNSSVTLAKQKAPSGQDRDDLQMLTAFVLPEEQHMRPEDKAMERVTFKEPPEVQYDDQHDDDSTNALILEFDSCSIKALHNNTSSQLNEDDNNAEVAR